MSVLLRALGMQAAYALFQSLSPRMARAASLLLLLGANAFPLMALLSGQWAAGDVLVAFWLEKPGRTSIRRSVENGIARMIRLARTVFFLPRST